MRRTWRTWIGIGAVGLGAVLAGPVSAEVVVTEIMYNPRSPERRPVQTEWVEVYNTGDRAADLSGWYLQDEDGRTGALPDGVSLDPRQAIVLIPGGCTAEAFSAAWGDDVRAYPLADWSGRSGLSGLANSPSETNEVLTLRDVEGQVADEVNYRAESPWPSDDPDGRSIYLVPGVIRADFNDDGPRWRFAEAGRHGAESATQTEVFDARDTGSPGVVVAEE